ncbi:hypothetical protein CGMCC3_g15464 [Colletotrichum fructicola]|uniref:Uncharacterized protein n=1 Tax=Colletotrichum fructicola (strain Nara gc5) TaxID=1213859 RepID=A0A7J6J0R0_COLFN|nr:uncharacterized protein CGMCC3_g15464 [Colletotrichum fructicola]KAE9568432.1 hypothetical protein CGMCC3_g15464 [Colletotrichum fructicola]KAF4482485.1 hypothetical protein CGGC5_v009836 [Colletotrichum fructicola Nara gc5]
MAEFADPDALPPLGFISIDLDIHRPPGDPYNEKTWPFPLIREMAEGSKVSQVVSSDQYDSAFIDRFLWLLGHGASRSRCQVAHSNSNLVSGTTALSLGSVAAR